MLSQTWKSFNLAFWNWIILTLSNNRQVRQWLPRFYRAWKDGRIFGTAVLFVFAGLASFLSGFVFILMFWPK